MTETVYESGTWKQLSDEEREAIQEWLAFHDIASRDIPMSESIEVRDGMIVYWGMTWEGPDRVKSRRDDHGNLHIVLDERKVELRRQAPRTAVTD